MIVRHSNKARCVSLRKFVSSSLSSKRYQSSSKLDKNDSKKKIDNDLEKYDSKGQDITSHKITSASSKASPAPYSQDKGIMSYLKKDNKVYIPKLSHKRLTYEFPGLPNDDNISKEALEGKPRKSGRWNRYLPKIAFAMVAAWGAYTVNVWFFSSEEGSDSNDLLNPEKFQKFIVTHKEDIDEDHFLIEVVPKYHMWQYSYYTNYEKNTIWNGSKIWSVEIKQPEIMVVRSYTPLPLYFMKSEYTRTGEKKPLLRVVNNDSNDCDKNGVMTFYIKKYKDGEVSRYIYSKNAGDELELRGPFIDYRFPFHPLKSYYTRPIFRDLPSTVEPDMYLEDIKRQNKLPDLDNLTFYAGGTGIAPILQVLFSRNPFPGFTTLHYFAQKDGELAPFERFLFFLEKLDRIKVIKHFDNDEATKFKEENIEPPNKPNYLSPMRVENSLGSDNIRYVTNTNSAPKVPDKPKIDKKDIKFFKNAIEQANYTKLSPKEKSSLSIISGPDGFISFLSGPKDLVANKQGPLTGLLGKKGWTNENTFKL